jgi:hypothetical protein
MTRGCSTQGRDQKLIQNVGKNKRGDLLEAQISKLKTNQDERMRDHLFWLQTGVRGRLSITCKSNFRF